MSVCPVSVQSVHTPQSSSPDFRRAPSRRFPERNSAIPIRPAEGVLLRSTGWGHVVWCTWRLIHVFIHSLFRSFIHSFIHSFVHSFIHSFIHTFLFTFFHLFSPLNCTASSLAQTNIAPTRYILPRAGPDWAHTASPHYCTMYTHYWPL